MILRWFDRVRYAVFPGYKIGSIWLWNCSIGKRREPLWARSLGRLIAYRAVVRFALDALEKP